MNVRAGGTAYALSHVMATSQCSRGDELSAEPGEHRNCEGTGYASQALNITQPAPRLIAAGSCLSQIRHSPKCPDQFDGRAT